MSEKFDLKKWHEKAIECSKAENQILKSMIQSLFDELYDYTVMLENLIKIDYEDNCHLADMCRERDARIGELEATIGELIKAGNALTSVAEWRYANLTELLAWDTLVDKIYKEREKLANLSNQRIGCKNE